MTIHELDAEPKQCGRIARRDTTVHICPDAGFAVGDMLHLHEQAWGSRTGRHVTATITSVERAADHRALLPGHAVVTLELYRTWVDGQAGPGDWSESSEDSTVKAVPR